MRILLVHSFYGSTAPSGENTVFEIERELLRSRGHVVEDFVRHSDEIRDVGPWGLLKGGLATAWNPFMASAMKRKIESFDPDVVHVHNTFPLLSPAIFYAMGKRAARVLTLHNYRLFCAAAIPVRRDFGICLECLEKKSAAPSLKYKCYRDSRLATLPLTLSVGLHRALGTWRTEVDSFIALTPFQRNLMIEAGLPDDRVAVKPNFFPGNPLPLPWKERSNDVVFAGRISAEKGLATLLHAWQSWGVDAPRLKVIGDGPLRAELQAQTASQRIEWLGRLSASQTQSEIAHAKLVILPSEWFECFPMVIREAFAFATAAAVSDVGPLPSIVQDGINGIVFKCGNSGSIVEHVRAAWLEDGKIEAMGLQARQDYEDKYTEDRNYQQLMTIYQSAMAMRASQGSR